MTKKSLLMVFLSLLILPVFAKRVNPVELPAIIHNGRIYNVLNEGNPFFSCGYLCVYDEKSGDCIKVVLVYIKACFPFVESDVQWVFVSNMELVDENTIQITNEKKEKYNVNLKTFKVKKVRATQKTPF